jgi:hypothetical protein
MQTNKEKRPLFIWGRKTGNNKTFSVMWAFMPSQCKWAFDWIFRTAIPQLMSSKALGRVQINMTDNDENEYGVFVAVSVMYYGGAIHGLCVWHMVDRGWKSYQVTGGKLGPRATKILHVLKQWLYSWSGKIESEKEFQSSRKLFFDFLAHPKTVRQKEGGLGKALIKNLKKFLTKLMLPNKEKWLRADGRLKRRTLDVRTSSNVEAENSVVKSHALGSKPSHRLNKSAKAIIDLNSSRFQQKNVLAAEDMDKSLTVAHVDGLHDLLTLYISDKLMIQLHLSVEGYDVYRVSKYKFYLKRRNYKVCSSNYKDDSFVGYMVPDFERTRVVKVVQVDGKFYLVCDCCLYECNGYSYRICVLQDESPHQLMLWLAGTRGSGCIMVSMRMPPKFTMSAS